MTETAKTVWVTADALDTGIREGRGGLSSGGVMVVSYGDTPATFCVLGVDCFVTREAALARAEQMRSAKIESLQRQVEKLKELRF